MKFGILKEGVLTAFTLPMALFLAVAASGMWAFIAVATWADSRRKEREAYYRHETMKKISEMPGDTGLELLREDERLAARRRRESIQLGGLVTSAIGIGLMIFLRARRYQRTRIPCGTYSLELAGLGLLAYRLRWRSKAD